MPKQHECILCHSSCALTVAYSKREYYLILIFVLEIKLCFLISTFNLIFIYFHYLQLTVSCLNRLLC
jgi:hypothetical protein